MRGDAGTVSEAQDAVQEAWLRLERDPGAIGDLRGWLTTVVGRSSRDMLRARKGRREAYPGSWRPEPLVNDPAGDGPSMRRCWPTRSAWPCPWCWKPSPQPNGSPSAACCSACKCAGSAVSDEAPGGTTRTPARNYPAIHRAGV